MERASTGVIAASAIACKLGQISGMGEAAGSDRAIF
jgi:hypothetical protein